MYLHKATGRIVYDPRRGGMKRRTEWWAIVRVDPEITRLLRWWVKKELFIDLNQQPWEPHISIVRGEKPRLYPEDWGNHNGELVNFHYAQDPKRTKGGKNDEGWFWYVDVICPRIQEIRAEFGLRTFYKSHLTFGRIYYD